MSLLLLFPSSQLRTWIRVSGTWHRAQPYIKISGVWKQAVAWQKINGVWEQI